MNSQNMIPGSPKTGILDENNKNGLRDHSSITLSILDSYLTPYPICYVVINLPYPPTPKMDDVIGEDLHT